MIFQTGGTINMISGNVVSDNGKRIQGRDSDLKPATHFSPLQILKHVPQLSQLAEIDVMLGDNIDSSNVTPRNWEKWLAQIGKVYEKYDGFVITHGTDTMVYTAAAFGFAMTGLSKPMVFTGSQKPLGDLRSDAPMNLINSVETACSSTGIVSLCFGNQLLNAMQATKLSATDYVAFQSFNTPHLATMGVDIRYTAPRYQVPFGRGGESNTPEKLQKKYSAPSKWQSKFNEKVFCFKIFPGISGEILMGTVRAKACQGMVLEAYGTGNVPDFDHSVLAMIREAKRLKKPVIISSQCPHGRVDLKKYDCGVQAEKAGAISGQDMTTEACVVKLMHGLGMKFQGANLRNYFQKNICGEMNDGN